MDRLIYVLIGIALGILLVILWPKRPEPVQTVKPPPREIEVVGARSSSVALAAPQDLTRETSAVKPRPVLTYPNASRDLLLDPPPTALRRAALGVAARLEVSNADKGLLYRNLQRPSVDVLHRQRTGPSIDHPDAAQLFLIKSAPEELPLVAIHTKPRIAIRGADRAELLGINPREELFGGD